MNIVFSILDFMQSTVQIIRKFTTNCGCEFLFHFSVSVHEVLQKC